ncbi:hypothetical protein C8R44DRAFT_812827 [Mycena epipterygia]|nr:hypothetical protein C8R44DRAFT_812827 [Mycena epipterygia]
MPQFNTTVEDYSPVISYSSDWRSGTSADSLADLYSDSSFTLTQTDGATASFVYNGTSFTIYGSKRGNHGFYQITVDGNAFPPDTGQAADPGQFQVPLFASPSLAQGLHTVTLTNQGTTFVDIDFITWQSSVGADNEQLIVNTVQDTDSSFIYTPANSWGTNPPSVGTYSGSSGHATATPGAFMTYTFEGDGVSLYGPVGPAGSPFSVSIDNGTPFNHTANKQFYQPQVLLYTATNLGPGQHTVKVAYQPSQAGQIFAIDYANVYTTPAQIETTSAQKLASSKGTLPSAAVAGIVIALLFILFILAGLLFFLRRRKARRNTSSLESPMVQPPANNRDIIVAPAMYPFAQQPPVRYPSSADGSYYRNGTTITVETQSQAYAPSASSESGYSPTSHYGVTQAGPSSSWQQNSVPALPVKGQPLQLPPTASQSLSHIPTAELRANRRVVPGRLQDFGPAPSQDFGPAPPNYSQSTEPYGGMF